MHILSRSVARRSLRAGRAAGVVLAALLLAPLARAGVTIAEAAPRTSFLIAGADDCAKLVAAFERSSLSALWKDPEFVAWRERVSGKTTLDPLGKLRAAGVDVDALKPPTGASGVALFLASPDSGAPGAPAGGQPEMQALALADFAEDEAGAKAAMDALERVAEQGVKDGVAKKDSVDYADVEITRVVVDYASLDRMIDERNGLEPAKDAGAQDADAENDAEFADFDEEFDKRSGLADRGLPGVLLFARVGAVVLAGSHLPTLKEAIDRAEGRPGGPGAGESPEFREALAQHEPGYHAYIVAPGKALGEYLAGAGAGAAPDLADRAVPGSGLFAEWGERVGAALGFEGVRALSATMRLDAPAGPADGSLCALVAEKRGLLALIDGPAKPLAPPTFVPADAATITVNRFNIAGLLPLLREVAKSLPPEDRNMFEGGLEMFGQQFGPALDAMGSEVAVVSRVESPYGASSERTIVALDVADGAKLSGALNTLGAGFGLTPREFQGNQIWDSNFGPGIGVGFGKLFLGEGPDIESALREAGDPERAKLGAEPAFQRTMAALGGSGIGFSFTRLRATMEWAEWQAKNIDRLLAEQFDETDWPAEDRAAFIEDMKAQMPAWSREPAPASVVLRHVGDLGAAVRSTPEGFVVRWLVTKPGE